MALYITDDTMTLKIDDRVVATARFSKHDAANENGAWIVSTHPARLFTCDQMMTALTWAASMVVLDASRRGQRVPLLAAWSLAAGIATTVGANLAHGLGHGAVVRSWNRRYEPGTPQATASRR
jgi:hypothetical protein